MWTQHSLVKVIKDNFGDRLFALVSNREPYLHTFTEDKKIKCQASIGGVSVTFDSIMRATRGVWIAYGGSAADKKTVDSHDHVKVPPKNPQYTLRRIWMSEEERKHYYEGFSNETIWPLSHAVFIKPNFLDADWQAYKAINKRFAKAVLEEVKGRKALIWLQDYHLALAAKYIKDARPDVMVAQFWHIPWPTQEIFRICPWKKEILTGLLCNDLLGFHRYYHVDNFLKTVARELEVKESYEDLTIEYKRHETKVGYFPISIDYQEITDHLKSTSEKEDQKIIDKFITGKYQILAVGVDRVDYTKGIPNRLLAIERFLDKYPSYKGKFVYLGIGAPSRTGIKTYRNLGREIEKLVRRINKKFAKGAWQPIYYVNQPLRRQEILEICRQADLCLVTPLDDGMNLVSKEYIVANRGDGALILSHFTGAAKELTKAFLINPYNIKEMAKTIKDAIETPRSEKISRMKKMKELIKDRNLFRWAAKFLLELAKLK